MGVDNLEGNERTPWCADTADAGGGVTTAEEVRLNELLMRLPVPLLVLATPGVVGSDAFVDPRLGWGSSE